MSTKKIVIFTPQIDGHYLEYVHHIYESEHKKKNSLYIFVVPEEFEKKRELLNWSEQLGISFDYLTKTECQKCLQSGRKNFYYSAKILAKHLKSNKADEAIVLTFVYVMPLICLLLPIGFKCKISGIIYHLYPYSWSKSSIYNKVRTFFTYFLFSKSNRIKNIFILNSRPGARLFNCIYRTNRFKYLTDPVNLSINAQRNIRDELQIPKGDKIILHFGAMSKAKGSLQVMQAIEASKGLINNHTFIFAGVVSEAIKEDFYNIYNKVDHSKVLLFDRFCEYEFVNNLLYTCDTIVIPYIQSGQSSGVVALGAFYHKPLVVLSGGFVGKLVRDYHLGVCIKDNTPESIINGILQLETQVNNLDCDRYVKEHSISEFCNQILS